MDAAAPVNLIKIIIPETLHPNTVESTFGFHSARTYPERDRELYLVDPYRAERRIINPHDPFGPPRYFVTPDLQTFEYEQRPQADVSALNIFTALGYYPILGIIPGLRRLTDINEDLQPVAVRTAHYVRGLFEVLGFGIIYLIPDLVVTLNRFYSFVYIS